MNRALEHLCSLFKLTELDPLVFLGHSHDLGFSRLFGGQVVGQGVVAAARTVSPHQQVHSLHGYFLRAGDTSQPVYYEVSLVRDGKSVATRLVTAKQGGVTIFSMVASFHKQEEGPSHQDSMPEVLPPEGLVSEQDLWRQYAHLLPADRRAKLVADRAIEIRTVDPIDPLNPEAAPPHKYVWFRAVDRLPDEELLHTAMLAYASDFGISLTALLPHSLTTLSPGLQVASLDHALWFHRPCRVDEWLLYVTDSPSASGARGFNRGQIFTKDGILVASVAQEGMMRRRSPSPPSS